MKRKLTAMALSLGMLVLLLGGCWDANYLIHKKMINGVGFDAGEKGHIDASVRAVILKSRGGGQFDVIDELIRSSGDSILTLMRKIDSMLPGTLEASKTQVIVIGEELAKQGVVSLLEPVIRNQKGYLNGSVLVSEGDAAGIISVKQKENTPAAYDILQMVRGAERVTNVPNNTLYTMWTQFEDQGEDQTVPYIHKINGQSLVIDSTALLSGDRYTGVNLNRDESTLLLLLKDKLDKKANLGVQPNQADSPVVSFDVLKAKRDLNVTLDPKTDRIRCTIRLDLYASVSSYPGTLGRTIDREKLNEELSDTLHKLAVTVLNKLQQANCDALGIGRKVRARYYAAWEGMDWDARYREVEFLPEVRVHLTRTGLIH